MSKKWRITTYPYRRLNNTFDGGINIWLKRVTMQKQVDVVKNAWKTGVVLPAFNIPYLPMMEPVIQAVVDEKSFALISTAQIEWETLESKGPREVMDEFQKWDKPDHVRIHLDHICSGASEKL